MATITGPFNNGLALIKDSINAFLKHPQLMIPLIACWICFTPLLVYLKFKFNWNACSPSMQWVISFTIIFTLSAILSWSCFVLLELIKQIETDQSPDIIRALSNSITNTIKALPIVILWAILWFILLILECIFSKEDGDDDSNDYNAENVARFIADADEFSLSGAFFNALQKAVRMIAFLILPAIAWEDRTPASSIKKGLAIAQLHKTEFASGFILTELAAIIIFLPASVVFIAASDFNINFPDPVWFIIIAYCAVAWSTSVFIEQIFVAELYLWHLIWRKADEDARIAGMPRPKMEDVKRPSILDNIADMRLTNLKCAKSTDLTN